MIRHADAPRDAPACAAIYAPWVAEGAVSFEDEPPGAADFAARIETMSRTHPWLVLEREGRVLGYAYGGPHRARAAYRWACEVAVYVDGAARRTGAGRELYGALLSLLAAQGLHVAYAGITLPNEDSVGLHRALGFAHVGTYERVGWKAGAWHDVSWWARELAPRTAAPPAEPRGPQRL